ncbi:hypothetical protein F5B19DRAFT_117045 [Rostrohypoxylon terebratum]|nr:hypothetical protein F5B19DRAFT_117045 [Rostrohypoxylon terebratum]
MNNESRLDERLLWIKGKLGSGKSTLVKNTLKYIPSSPGDLLVAYFCPQKEKPCGKYAIHRSRTGLLRALVFELLIGFPNVCEDMKREYEVKSAQDPTISWEASELEYILRGMFMGRRDSWTTIILDGMDGFGAQAAKKIVQFLRGLSRIAHDRDAKLRVCFVSRTSLPIDRYLWDSLEIIVDRNNRPDIVHYVNNKMLSFEGRLNNVSLSKIKDAIIHKSSGVFLWVAVTIDMLLDDYDDGIPWRSDDILINNLDKMPEELEDLYIHVMKELSERKDRKASIQLFLWALFSLRPLQVPEFQEVLSLIDRPEKSKSTEFYSTTHLDDCQFLKRVRRLSRGLIEVNETLGQLDASPSLLDGNTCGPVVGSFDNRKIIQPIHESLREFFINRGGFKHLDREISSPVRSAHLAILTTSLDYCDQLLHLETHRHFLRGQTPSVLSEAQPETVGSESLQWSLDLRLKFASTSLNPDPPIGASASIYAPSAWSNTSSGRINSHSVGRSQEPSERSGNSVRSLPLYQTPDWHHNDDDSSRANRSSKRECERLTANNLSKVPVTDDKLEATMDWFKRFPILSESNQASLPINDRCIGSGTGSPVPSVTRTIPTVAETIPALRSYIEETFLFHAMAHQDKMDRDGQDPDTKQLVNRLQHKSWYSWRRLCDDIPADTTFTYFIAEWNLVSWAPYVDEPDRHFCEKGGQFQFPITVAARKSNLEMIRFILKTVTTFKEGLRLGHLHEFDDKKRRTVLHYTASKHDPAPLDAFLQMIPRDELEDAVNETDVWGQTPLHIAAYNGSIPCAEALLRAGARRTAVDGKGKTPLQVYEHRNDLPAKMRFVLMFTAFS